MHYSKEDKLEKIVNLNSRMSLTNNLEELLRIILNESEKLFEVEGTSILLEDKMTGKLYFHIATGEKKDFLKTITMEPGEGVCGYVFQTGKSLIENDTANSPFFSVKVDRKSSFITRNLLCVPLQIEDQILGVFELVNKISGDFDQEDLDFLTAVASQVSITLERARLTQEKIQAERLATIGETITGLSHCIKNILNGLQGGAYIINKYLEDIKSEKIKLGWDIVNDNIKKISSLTLDMLSYSKERIPVYQKTSLQDIIDDILRLLEKKLQENNIKVEKKYDAPMNEIEIDPDSIYRALLNLITNAVDALQDRENAVITIGIYFPDQDKVQLEISDNGCGIPVELLNKLFCKFFSTKGAKGTGLGLPVTKKIIEEHKGRITVESSIGKGTTFRIELPRRKTDSGLTRIKK
ncbi:MAG: GAF domain-containing protein [Candidatus Cloacimonetes bacterium]|nr:GAF domain-containing protein [Candidatus Cloacimonadota bacterium]